jgi:hypothetical protein
MRFCIWRAADASGATEGLSAVHDGAGDTQSGGPRATMRYHRDRQTTAAPAASFQLQPRRWIVERILAWLIETAT